MSMKWVRTAAVAWCLLTLGVRTVANMTSTWLSKRDALIGSVYGHGDGVLPSLTQPAEVLHWPEAPGLQGLVWDLSDPRFFQINSTVFYSPVEEGKKSKDAFMFHHGHSDCICPHSPADPAIEAFRCRPGCNSSMPSLAELGDPGYSWWDLYNVSGFFHSIGYDVFILSMPLKGINIGPGSSRTSANHDHWWFQRWEEKGDSPLRCGIFYILQL